MPVGKLHLISKHKTQNNFCLMNFEYTKATTSRKRLHNFWISLLYYSSIIYVVVTSVLTYTIRLNCLSYCHAKTTVLRKLALLASPVFQHVPENGGRRAASSGVRAELKAELGKWQGDDRERKRVSCARSRKRFSHQYAKRGTRFAGGGRRWGYAPCSFSPSRVLHLPEREPYTGGSVQPLKPPPAWARSPHSTFSPRQRTLRLALRLFVRGSHRRCARASSIIVRRARRACVRACVLSRVSSPRT